MAEMMTVKQASEIWGIFDSRITKLCREGKNQGTVKSGKCVSRSENRSCTGFEPHPCRLQNRTAAAPLTAP